METDIFRTKISFNFYLIKISLFLGIIISVFLSIKQLPGFALLIVLFSFLFYYFKVKIIKMYADRFVIEEIHFPKRFSKKQSVYFNEIKEMIVKRSGLSMILVIVFHDGSSIENTISASMKEVSKTVFFINEQISNFNIS